MVKRAVVRELMDDSSCIYSISPKKKTSDRPRPAAAPGGCAFEGAQISLFPFADAAHLVHGPMTCLGASWETRETPTSYEGRDLTQMGFATEIDNNTVIFGGSEKLEASINYIVENYHPEAVFVYLTCVTALIGENVDVVCKKMQERHGLPVISVNAPGFMGAKNLGSRLAANDVFHKLIGTKEPEYTTPYDINLIGEYNVTGDMWQYLPILEELGIRVLSTFSGDGRIEKIKYAHRAKLNVVMCAKSLVSFARQMEKKYAIPFIFASFYGKSSTTQSIMDICYALDDKELIKRAKVVCAREEAKLEKELAPYKAILKGKKAVLNTGGNKAWSFASALQDLGITVVATSVRKSIKDDVEQVRKLLGEDVILMNNPGKEQAKIAVEHNVDIMLAGGRSLYTALKKKIPFCDVNQEKYTSYGAYGGMVAFARNICAAVENPVFKNVSKPAPWEVK
jgi:nitrogenase molybdenum-cofactor synthesis protein NifE